MKFVKGLWYLLTAHFMLVSPVQCEGKDPRDVYCFIEALHRGDLQTVENLYNTGAADLTTWQSVDWQAPERRTYYNKFVQRFIHPSVGWHILLFSTFNKCWISPNVSYGTDICGLLPIRSSNHETASCPCQNPDESYRRNRAVCIRFLIEHGVDVNARETVNGHTLLMRAALDGDDILVAYLLSVPGIDINASYEVNNGWHGKTALDFAIRGYYYNVVEISRERLENCIRMLTAAGAANGKQNKAARAEEERQAQAKWSAEDAAEIAMYEQQKEPEQTQAILEKLARGATFSYTQPPLPKPKNPKPAELSSSNPEPSILSTEHQETPDPESSDTIKKLLAKIDASQAETRELVQLLVDLQLPASS